MELSMLCASDVNDMRFSDYSAMIHIDFFMPLVLSMGRGSVTEGSEIDVWARNTLGVQQNRFDVIFRER